MNLPDSSSPPGRPRFGAAANAIPVLVASGVMWVEEVVDSVLNGRLDRFGIMPRRLSGLDGILFAPFLHSGFRHLVSNTIPFLLLGLGIAISGVARWVQVTVIVALVGGVGVWLVGRSGSVHIGASGLVFGYLTYLVSRGLFARKPAYLLGGVLAFLAYGGILWGLLPTPGVSWSGHVFGAVGGVVAAVLLHRRRSEEAVAAPGLLS
jgi:membrane associated rhomboid family serine protease